MLDWERRGSSPSTAQRLLDAGWTVSTYGHPWSRIPNPGQHVLTFQRLAEELDSQQGGTAEYLRFADLWLLRAELDGQREGEDR